MMINLDKGDKNIIINDIMKEYVASNKFIKYLGVPIGSKRISKPKFRKFQKNLIKWNIVGWL
jgi:hypothetical protein